MNAQTKKLIEAGFQPIQRSNEKPGTVHVQSGCYTVYLKRDTNIVEFSDKLNATILAWEHTSSFSGQLGDSIKGYLWIRYDYRKSDYQKFVESKSK